VATLVCALSTSIEMLIVARVFQAIGGSGGIVLARAIVRDLYSGPRAGRELSLIGSVMALAPVFAPVLGGVMQTGFGWRSVFFALVAAGIGGAAVVLLLLPETLKLRAAERVSPASMLASYRIVVRNPAYLAYLALGSACYAGLFAWISGASFVLQNLYGLTPFHFGVAFASASIGFMIGATIAARLVVHLGIDRTIGIGACALTAGGLGMGLSVALGLTSALSLVLPVSVYLAGLGMVLPQSIAGAMTPFPERAGAASSLFGFLQQSTAAACGAVVGLLLGHNAWPLAGGVAFMGIATLVIWLTTRGVRARYARHG
jgi:DHA1 family bicyclomycin/chloramphenicol resistance-like MFS transporter